MSDQSTGPRPDGGSHRDADPVGCEPAPGEPIDRCALAHRPADPQHLSTSTPGADERVTVRLEARAGDAQHVAIRVWIGFERVVAMTRSASKDGVDTFEALLPASARALYYRFVLQSGAAVLYLTRAGPTAVAPEGANDFFIAPQASGKTLHYRTDFAQPELHVRSGTGDGATYSATPMKADGDNGAHLTAVGATAKANEDVFFFVRDQATGHEDHPPGGGDYRIPADLTEVWLDRGAVLDVPLELLDSVVVDAHTHPFDRKDNWFVHDPAPMLALLPKEGITHAVTMTIGTLAEQKTWLTGLRQAHPWIIPLAWVKADTDDAAQVEDLLANHAFRGLKFHPAIDNYPADGPKMDAFMQLARKYRVPVQIHSAWDDTAKPTRTIALAQRHPNVAVIMIHTVLGALDKTEALGIVGQAPNVYAETSWTNPQSILQAMTVLDSSRVIMGTDATVDGGHSFSNKSIANPQGEHVYTIPEVLAEVKATAHPAAYANWARLNAIRLYGLRFGPTPQSRDTDGDGQPDVSDADDDNDGQPDDSDAAPLSPAP